jgi:hypothetical protein
MPNHVHLALKTGQVPLSRLMARLGTGYARTFNRRHDRVGHLFQNRFKSRLVKDERDLMGLVLYIHRNPTDALLVADTEALRHFPWCGHGALMGALPARPFESPSATLRLFAEDPGLAREQVRHWMGDPTCESEEIEHSLDASFSIAKGSPVQTSTAGSLTDLIDQVCEAHRLDRDALGRGRRASTVLAARAELSRRATRELGLPSSVVARALGVSDSTISRALRPHEKRASRKQSKAQ